MLQDDIDDFAFKTFFQGSMFHSWNDATWQNYLPTKDLGRCMRAFSMDRRNGVRREIKAFPQDYHKIIYTEYFKYQRAKSIRAKNIASMQVDADQEIQAAGNNIVANILEMAMNDVAALDNLDDNPDDLDVDQLPIISSTQHLYRHSQQNSRVRPINVLDNIPMPSINKQPRLNNNNNNDADAIDDDANFNPMDYMADFDDI
jgi:hypothetical protein